MSSALSGNGLPVDYRSMPQRDRYRMVASSGGKPRGPLDTQMGEDIDINKLVGAHNKRREQRAQIYELIYRKCCHRIRYANDVQYVKECHFKIPEVQLWNGVPRYHLNSAIAYTMIKLKKKGFDVKYIAPDGIMVNWQRLVGTAAVTPIPTFEEPTEKTIRYVLDEVTTAAPNKDIISNGERLLHRGCTGDCCVKPNSREARDQSKIDLSKHAKLELDRQRQQDEIDRLISRRDRNGRSV